MGRSIITSNIEPMASICGTGGYLVNPIKVKEIENTILKIIKDEKVRNERIQEGLDNIKKYDLKTIAKKYIEFYEKNIIGD